MNMDDSFSYSELDFDFSISTVEYEHEDSFHEDSFHEEARKLEQEMLESLDRSMNELIIDSETRDSEESDEETSDSEESDEESHPAQPDRGGGRLLQLPYPCDLPRALHLPHTPQQQLQDRRNMNSSTKQNHVSLFVHDTAVFEWEIENFSTEKLPANKDKFIESQYYKFSNMDWSLKLSRHSGNIYLTLSPCQTKNLPLLFTCTFQFHSAPGKNSYIKKYTEPVNIFKLCAHLAERKLTDKCIADGTLTVSCELRKKEFIHLQPKKVTAAIEKETQGHSTLTESMASLLDDAEFSDITLKIGEDTVRAHKAILASRSKVFRGMFESGMRESKVGVVNMEDMKPSTTKEMLWYIYTGKVEKLSMDRAMDLYSAADRYDLQELRGWCRDFIVEHVSADKVCDLVLMADLHRDEELAKVARKVFQQECKTIVTTRAWREFAKYSPSLYMDLVESIILNES